MCLPFLLQHQETTTSLRIAKAKPNPAGKNRLALLPLNPSQLAAEWLDIRNISTMTVNLKGVALTNRRTVVMEFAHLLLAPNQTFRVHSGKDRGGSVIRAVDKLAAEIHVFTGIDEYIWDNWNGDTAALWDVQRKLIDGASYAPDPPEGAMLVRVGCQLLVPASMYYCRFA
jgi:hypothetical protein